MPGGRGTLLDIAASLNNDKPVEVKAAIMTAIDSGDYVIVNTSVAIIGAAYDKCDNPKELLEIWMCALDKHAVDWGY